MDIGVRNGVEGFDFLNGKVLIGDIYRITDFLRNLLSSWVPFDNMDLAEINSIKTSTHLITRGKSNLSDCSKYHQKSFMEKEKKFH
jgi:hypothetical protein